MRIFYIMRLMDAGCPVTRHELIDTEWFALGELKAEMDRLAREKQKGR